MEQGRKAGVETRRGDKARGVHQGKARGPVWSNRGLRPEAQGPTRHITPHTRSSPPSLPFPLPIAPATTHAPPLPAPREGPIPFPSPLAIRRDRTGGRPCIGLHATGTRRPWRRSSRGMQTSRHRTGCVGRTGVMGKGAGAVGRGAGWKHAAWRGAAMVAGPDDSDRREKRER